MGTDTGYMLVYKDKVEEHLNLLLDICHIDVPTYPYGIFNFSEYLLHTVQP